jgi:FtsH-binding integral membrane protein
MAKRKTQNSLTVGENVDNSIIQVGDNPTTNIHNNIDGEKVGQSLGETLNESANQARWEKWIHESQREDSRQVMETVFVSLVSGLAIGLCWKLAFPWNVETIPFFVIGAIILFNILRITNFGLRRSIFKVILLTIAFSLLLEYTSFTQTWMEINQFVGAAILATLGAVIGLFVGVIQLFWRPLED